MGYYWNGIWLYYYGIIVASLTEEVW